MLSITYIPIFNDNYVWVIVNPENRQCAIIDPGEAQPIINFLKAEGLNVCAILITHHHWDHIGGVDDILKEYNQVLVYAPKKCNLNCHSIPLSEGDVIEIPALNLDLQIFETPGHTLDHIAYYSHPYLFCGDTLFSAGCGRLFEGTPHELYQSLQRLADLPDETQVYCTHEYTLNNLAFAEKIEPDNQDIQLHIKKCQTLRRQGLPTLPSTIGLEKEINPFLRCHTPQIINTLNDQADIELQSSADAFAELRRLKDQF